MRMYYRKNISKISALLTALIITNFFSHFIKSITGTGATTYYICYICWGVYFIYLYVIKQNVLELRFVMILMFLFVSAYVGAIWGQIFIGKGYSEFHKVFFIIVAIACTTNRRLNTYLVKDDIECIFKGAVFSTFIPTVYTIIAQNRIILELVKGQRINYNSWKLTSFFGQRNVFGESCFIGLCACMYLYRSRKHLFYLMVIILQYIMIYLTNSRSALLGATITIAYNYIYKKKNKYLYVLFVIGLLFVLFYYLGLSDYIMSSRATHRAFNGEDSGMLRIHLWKLSIQYLLQCKAMLFGFGWGNIAYFRNPYGLGSAHSMYVDALFDGGIVFLSFLVYNIFKSYKKINSIPDANYRCSMISNMVAFLTYCTLEAGMALFQSNYFSVTTTILFIAIPNMYVGDNGEHQQGNEDKS